MEQAKKIAPTRGFTHMGIPVILLSSLALLFIVVAGEASFRLIFAAVMGLMAMLHLVFALRLHNLDYLVPLFFYLFAALAFFSIEAGLSRYIIVAFAACAMLFFILFVIYLVKRKIKWRQREMLELAARTVSDAADGYTARPYPLGKVEICQQTLRRFARFSLKHAIAYPYFSSGHLSFVLPRYMIWRLLGMKRNCGNETAVTFSEEGEVSVRIAARDYGTYREQLTFDQLCASLGHLILEFYRLYGDGREKEIIDRLNALRFLA